LADFFDGFGGGWSKEQILKIMKDSRVGTYGVIALIFMFLLKFLTLQIITTDLTTNLFHVGLIFIAYHSLSRLTAITLSFTDNYVRDTNSKSKPVAKSSSWKEVVMAYLFGLLPLIGLLYFSWIYVAIIPLLILIFSYFRWYLNKWIGGYTGDCLGAVEQFSELACLLTFTVL
jgi:adenosylcobinamide-GDP ribazoletransferase